MRKMLCNRFGLGFVSLVIALAGCGAAGVPTYQVRGTVTFDGEPVEQGQIIFFPVEEGLTPDAGPIKDGKYSFAAREGEKRVHIEATREVPGKTVPRPAPLEGEDPVMEMYIPEIYNKKTVLEATVTNRDADNQFNFELTEDDSGA